MFGIFRRKSKASIPRLPPVLYFKSNQAAFEYACKYMITSLENQQSVLAIVLEVQGDNISVKLSNKSDPSIPTQDPSALLSQGKTDNICLAAEKLDRVPSLKKDDLVIFAVPEDLATLAKATGLPLSMVGFILAKVQPAYSLVQNNWVMAND